MCFDSSRVRSAALAVAMVALSACGDRAGPTVTAPELHPQHAICLTCGGGGGDEAPPSISSVNFPNKTFSINGPSVGYTASVSDPGGASGLTLVGTLIQGSATRRFAAIELSCGVGITSCTGSSTISAAGFAPGSATFRLKLLDEFGAVTSTVNIAVTLVSGTVIQGDTGTVVAISQVILPSTPPTIGAPPISLRATVISKIASFNGRHILAKIVQPQGVYTAFEVAIPCGEGQVICNFDMSLALPSGVTGGPALLELEVINAAHGTAIATLVQRLDINITIAGT